MDARDCAGDFHLDPTLSMGSTQSVVLIDATGVLAEIMPPIVNSTGHPGRYGPKAMITLLLDGPYVADRTGTTLQRSLYLLTGIAWPIL